jgi:glutamine---fructose-6-phosphate transaminase (isomerizing)
MEKILFILYNIIIMCGITAVIGNVNCYEYTMFALKMLQNRGYDSAGICGINNNNFILNKYASINGQSAITILDNLNKVYQGCNICIGHSRWATTGIVSNQNAHPHIDYKYRFALAHNGIIENYNILKKELIDQYNVTFRSETDTEVIVNMISVYFDELCDVKLAIEKTLSRLEGTWGLVIIYKNDPATLYCARHGSPLLIGFGDNCTLVSSEQSGFCKYVKNYVCLNNNDIVIIKKNKYGFDNMDKYEINKITPDIQIELSPHPYNHWTIKEIYEQHESSYRALGCFGRILNNQCVKLGGLQDHIDYLKNVDNIILLGCGTSYNAGLYSLNKLKEISGFNTVQIFDAADFNLYDIPKSGITVLVLISQSGETKDLH